MATENDTNMGGGIYILTTTTGGAHVVQLPDGSGSEGFDASGATVGNKLVGSKKRLAAGLLAVTALGALAIGLTSGVGTEVNNEANDAKNDELMSKVTSSAANNGARRTLAKAGKGSKSSKGSKSGSKSSKKGPDSHDSKSEGGPTTTHKALLAAMNKYPDYNGDIAVTGSAGASFRNNDDLTAIAWMLQGLPPSTSGGIHIHAGTTCADASLVGGHYWTPVTDDDPWNDVMWQSDVDGASVGTFTVSSGYDAYDENLSHAVVVHDPTGARVACGTLQPTPSLDATFGAYPGYDGTIAVAGTATAYFDETQGRTVFSWELTGLPRVVNLDDNKGGIHIHAGTTCDLAEEVGGHYWTPMSDMDPWNDVVWKSNSVGEARGMEVVSAGYDRYAETVGHAVVVHDSSGARVACGVLR